MPDDLISDILRGTTGAFDAAVYNMAKDDVLDPDEWPLAQRIERPNCCRLCADRDGKIIAKTNPDYKRFLRQIHINCGGYWVDIHRDEGHEEEGPDGQAVWVRTQPDWGTVDPELIRKHGHFVADPEKYRALNVPARPTGRDFVFYRGRDGAPSRLVFAPALSDANMHALARYMLRTVFERAMGGQILPGDSNLVVQIARQAGTRGRREVHWGLDELDKLTDPDEDDEKRLIFSDWFDHARSDVRHHAADWQENLGIVLSDREYFDMVRDVAARGEPAIGALRYWAEKRGDGGAWIDVFAVRAPVLRTTAGELDDAGYLIEVANGKIWHAGRPIWEDYVHGERQFTPMRGAWND